MKSDRDTFMAGTIPSNKKVPNGKRIERNVLLQLEVEKYRQLVQEVNSIILILDTKGNITFTNNFALKFFGYTPEEIYGRNVVGTIVPETDSSGKNLTMLIRDLIQHTERYINNENENMCKNGRLVWVSWTNRAVRDPESDAIEILCIGNPITERKEAEKALREAHARLEEQVGKRTADLRRTNKQLKKEISVRLQAERSLRESEEKYRLLVSHATDAIFIAQDGFVKFPNQATMRLTGYTEGELSRRPFTNLIHPEDQALVLERHRKRLNGNNPPSAYSFRIINRSGNILWVQINTVRIAWEGLPATLNVLRDITRQKQIESALFEAKKMESIGTLAGGIAHDFNNLLMGIQGRTSIMKLDTDSDHPHSRHLKEIENYIASAQNLTRQILGYARGGKYQVQVTDLNNLINRYTRMFQETQKEVPIFMALSPGLWPTAVDRGQIEQVLFNLYLNACEAMPDGGQIRVMTNNARIDSDKSQLLISQGKYVQVDVTDEGIGMDADTTERIFDPFFTTKEIERGTGLGLAAVYGIIKNHGGVINVKSEPGKGTTFNIFLPVSQQPLPLTKPKSSQAISPVSETTAILLIDDEKMVLDVGRQMLCKLGYKVLTAKSGRDGIKLYMREQKHIMGVILDMAMPGLNGTQTYAQLRQINPEVTVILSSGYSIEEQTEAVQKLGCAGFIQKPFGLEQLSQKLRAVFH